MPMGRGKMFVLGAYTAQRVSDYNNVNYPQIFSCEQFTSGYKYFD